MRSIRIASLVPCAAIALLSGCSIRQMAIDMVADAVSSSGGVFTTDEDVELVGDAIPFGLKMYESLLAQTPRHRGLLLSTAGGFTQYAYGFVQQEADRCDEADVPRARELRRRARRLFLRSRDYAFRGLEVEHPGFRARLRADPAKALAETTKEDVPFLYWAGVSWAAALAAVKDDWDLVADLPTAGEMVKRVLSLDEGFDGGAAHEFLINFEGSRSAAMGGSVERARVHYARAVELSGGKRASPHLTLAESVSVGEQNLVEYRKLLAATLAVDPDAVPEQRLANTIAQRRARWLETRIADRFLDFEPEEKKP